MAITVDKTGCVNIWYGVYHGSPTKTAHNLQKLKSKSRQNVDEEKRYVEIFSYIAILFLYLIWLFFKKKMLHLHNYLYRHYWQVMAKGARDKGAMKNDRVKEKIGEEFLTLCMHAQNIEDWSSFFT